ncbi:tetratricopeptide repeat protein, partial [Vagococcus penaei]
NYLRDLGRHQEAIILMEQLLEKQPKRVDYLFHLANSLSQLGQFEAARTTLLKAAILQPDNPLFVEQVKNIDARDKLVSK